VPARIEHQISGFNVSATTAVHGLRSCSHIFVEVTAQQLPEIGREPLPCHCEDCACRGDVLANGASTLRLHFMDRVKLTRNNASGSFQMYLIGLNGGDIVAQAGERR